ncbi:MAG: response regulator transcription factor [Chloroflexi bacterium]|nr:response regulator transcription factor [Chloroflexota bacterium]
MNEPITVLLVDDHAIVRQGIRAFLETQPDIQVVGEAATGAEAVAVALETAPDVVLMDLIMPDSDGVEATRALRRVSPHSQVVILTSYHEDEHIFPAIKAGALSYLLKDIAPDELADAVRGAARGEASIHPSVATRLVAEVRQPRRAGVNPFTELSDREFQVLGLIAEGLDNATIAERLSISEKTVKSHVSNILSKLHLADRTQAAVFAWKEGIAR